jgi:mono/diheme cytochrome c family protein
MHFSLKHKIAPRVRIAQALAFTAVFSLLLSGCTEHTAKIAEPTSPLVSQADTDARLAHEDFAFPSQPPSLKQGRLLFQQHCMKCHAASFWQTQKVKEDIAYSTPIDTYLMLTTGKAPAVVMPTAQRKQVLPHSHPSFKDVLTRDDRWAVIFYARYLAGAGDIKSPDPKTDVANIFGGNCAVCHGTKGRADGPLHTGKTGNHELHDAELHHDFVPPPADFRQYDRMYNRTDAQLFRYICQGIYPSGMPSWYGNVNVDKDTGKVTYVFNDQLIWNLVRHVRTLAYNNDLDANLPEVKNPPAGLQALQSCDPVPQNQPWYKQMQELSPYKGKNVHFQADPVTGGMTFQSRNGKIPQTSAGQGE